MAEYVVKVHDTTCELIAKRMVTGTRIIWVVVGNYLDKQFKGLGVNETSAIYSWVDQARTRP
jgi:hypothetical protein